MRDTPSLPRAEFELMDVLWQKGEATTKEIQAALTTKTRKPAYTTIATLLSRLRDKGYVHADERDFAYVFRPLVGREEVVRRKLDDLVKQVFGGDVAPLALYIAEKCELTPEQIATLEEIVQSECERQA